MSKVWRRFGVSLATVVSLLGAVGCGDDGAPLYDPCNDEGSEQCGEGLTCTPHPSSEAQAFFCSSTCSHELVYCGGGDSSPQKGSGDEESKDTTDGRTSSSHRRSP